MDANLQTGTNNSLMLQYNLSASDTLKSTRFYPRGTMHLPQAMTP